MNQIADHSNLQQLLPGTVLRISRGLYDHVALLGEYAWAGERQVLSFGREAFSLQEIPFSKFVSGRTIKIDGYLGQLAPQVVLAQARRIGVQRRYSWLGFNCEHFVRAAHGAAIESPQLGLALLLGLCAALLST